MENNERMTDEELYNQIIEKANYKLSDEEIQMIFKLIKGFQNEVDEKKEKQENQKDLVLEHEIK